MQMNTASDAGLIAWLASRGGSVSPKLNLFHRLDSGDRGVVAVSDIAPGEQLAILPAQSTLHVPSAEEFAKSPSSYNEVVKFVVEHDPKPSPFIATSLVLMYEMTKGRTSPFWTYIQSLPRDFDCVMTWSEDEKAELAGTAAEDLDTPQWVYEKKVKAIVQARPDLWPEPFGSLEHFVRAAAAVQSRAFYMKGDRLVIDPKEKVWELRESGCELKEN
eukprot:gene20557-27349_t